MLVEGDRELIKRVKEIIKTREKEIIKYNYVMDQLNVSGKWKAVSSFYKSLTDSQLKKLCQLEMPVKSFDGKNKNIYVLNRIHHQSSYVGLLVVNKNCEMWKEENFWMHYMKHHRFKIYVSDDNQAKIIGFMMNLENENQDVV